MEILVRVVLCISTLLAGAAAFAGPYDTAPNAYLLRAEAEKKLCSSTEEFIKALKFLRETKEFKFHEDEARGVALKVSAGCSGAAERFAQILILIRTTGFSEKKSLEMALQFAASSEDVQKNFLEIFSKSFLKEFFDYESTKALNVAYELSRDYKGDAARAREDYIALAKFCKGNDKLGLPMAFCSEYVVQVVKLSQYYQDGVVEPFMDLFKKLRSDKQYGLDMKLSLEVAYNILKSGPKSPENFHKAFSFAVEDLRLDKRKSIEFALLLADRSFIGGKEPPVLQFPANSSVVP
jgi:hypothetical protein